MGQTNFARFSGFLQNSANSAVSCVFCETAPPKCGKSKEKQKSTKICENLRQTADMASFVPSSLSNYQKPGNHPNFRKNALGAKRPFSELSESSGVFSEQLSEFKIPFSEYEIPFSEWQPTT